MGNWGIERLGNWVIGVLGCLGIGVLGYWGIGVLGDWGTMLKFVYIFYSFIYIFYVYTFLKPANSDMENGIQFFLMSPENNHIQRKLETGKATLTCSEITRS